MRTPVTPAGTVHVQLPGEYVTVCHPYGDGGELLDELEDELLDEDELEE
jgi:hypothetical protein